MSKPYQEGLTKLLGKGFTPTAPPGFASGPLEVNVIFTGPQATAAGLNFAQGFARELGAHIRLRAAIAVPLQLPLDEPSVSIAFLQENLRNLVSQLEPDSFAPSVYLYLCRDCISALLQVLAPNSLVVIGGPKRWWPTAERRMARALRSKGHRVILVDSRVRSGSKRPLFEGQMLAR
jgi:hypothetical protein